MSLSAFTRGLANGAWIASCSRYHARFVATLDHVEGAQSRYLLHLIGRNAETRFGVKHGFVRIRSVAEYQESVPVTGYEALSQDIEAIASGEQSVLTADRVTLLQPTSGS